MCIRDRHRDTVKALSTAHTPHRHALGLRQPELLCLRLDAPALRLPHVDVKLPAVHTDCLLLQALANAVRGLAGEIVLQPGQLLRSCLLYTSRCV